MLHLRKNQGIPKQKALSSIAIWLWGIFIVSVAVISTWGMLHYFGNDAANRTRLEAIRIASTLAVSTGGAAALLITARRQRFNEIDGTERRVTEMQAKAVEQLGHEKAAVRFAGLYSLERLAQDHPNHRQTVVNIICAYLRMPFAPPPDQPINHPIKRNRLSGRRQGCRTAWARQNHGSDDRFQEQQVRLAGQEILRVHLQRNSKFDMFRKNEKHWKDIEVDLSGAILKDFDFLNCQTRWAKFSEATFYGSRTRFSFARTDTLMDFNGAVFQSDSTDFAHVEFHGARTTFNGARFAGDADFNYAWIACGNFKGTKFMRKPSIHRARFGVKKNDYLAPDPELRKSSQGGYMLAQEQFDSSFLDEQKDGQ